MLGGDVAALAYTVHEELTVEGKPVTLDAADVSVWVRRNGRWLCALHTESVKVTRSDAIDGRAQISSGTCTVTVWVLTLPEKSSLSTLMV
jgi:hypothetical protein